jgi:hypothetical protein
MLRDGAAVRLGARSRGIGTREDGSGLSRETCDVDFCDRVADSRLLVPNGHTDEHLMDRPSQTSAGWTPPWPP